MSKVKSLFCNKTLQVLVFVAAVATNKCYLYWHHSPDMPDCMMNLIESDK